MHEEIKQLLKDTYPGMTLQEIGKHLGFSVAHFNSHTFGLKIAVKLAKATGRPIMDFWHK